jgi:peroxiredoxin
MQNRTETLGIGSRAPNFSLTAANCEGVFSLSSLRARRLVILEFVRGTW